MLLDSGDIVLIADSQGVMDSYEATGTAIDAKAPVAVLVNKGTASASEVTLLPLQHQQSYWHCGAAVSRHKQCGRALEMWFFFMQTTLMRSIAAYLQANKV